MTILHENPYLMDAQERKTLKRAITSKESWKAKARERQKGMRLLQLKIRDLELSRALWKVRYYSLKDAGETDKASEISAELLPEAKTDRKKN